jgi:hypothetical protein
MKIVLTVCFFVYKTVSHEFQFVIEVLHYMQNRLSSTSTIQSAQEILRLNRHEDSGVGVFLNLNCGHNNSFSNEEKEQLLFWLNRALSLQGEVI